MAVPFEGTATIVDRPPDQPIHIVDYETQEIKMPKTRSRLETGENVIDIHTHILHGLDDGAESFDTSVAMASLALETGTTDIVATPHSNISYGYEPGVIDSRIQDLQQAVGGGIKIHRGCDFHLSLQNIEAALRDPQRYAINGLGYLLVEFPDVSPLQGVDHIFETLRGAGLIPIVTHPERNPYLAADLERLSHWVKRGIYLQLTAQSITGELFGPEIAHWCSTALKIGLVHFVASDAHDTRFRTPTLDRVKAYLEKHFGEDYAELLLETHPRAAIEGRSLASGPVVPSNRQKKKWFQFGV